MATFYLASFVVLAIAGVIILPFTIMASICATAENNQAASWFSGFGVAFLVFVPFCLSIGILAQDYKWTCFVTKSDKMEYHIDKQTGGAVLQWKENK